MKLDRSEDKHPVKRERDRKLPELNSSNTLGRAFQDCRPKKVRLCASESPKYIVLSVAGLTLREHIPVTT